MGAGGEGLRERMLAGRGDGLLDGLVLERGSMSDYDALGAHHYLGGRPATVSRVWVLRRGGVSVVGRFLGRGCGGADREVVGVLVESNPCLHSRVRDVVFGGRYAGLGARQRGLALYREVRCISRVVVEPRWRGLGLAVRLVGHALAAAETRYVEASAAMGRVHPFFERAGMVRCGSLERGADARLRAALGRVGVGEGELADAGGVVRLIEGLGGAERYWVGLELRRWCRGRGLGVGGGLEGMLRAVRGGLGFEPVYYVWDRRWGEGKVGGDG